MTLELSTNGAIYENGAKLSGDPAVVISATGVTFINLANWLVDANSISNPAIRLTQGGNTIVNRAGAVINGYAGTGLAIAGSTGNDTVDNAGSISGRIMLGLGADTYIERAFAAGVNVDFGEGDDTARFTLAQSVTYAIPTLTGGAGFDTLQIEGLITQLEAASVTGFERLVITDGNDAGISGVNVLNLSGLSEIVISNTGLTNFGFSQNSAASVTMNGGTVMLTNGSTVNSVTGSEQSDQLWLANLDTPLSPVISSIDLGGGDDVFRLTQQTTAQVVPGLPVAIQGGAGRDLVLIGIVAGTTFDMGLLNGFEVVDTSNWSTSAFNTRLIHLDGFEFAYASHSGSLTIGETSSSSLIVVPGYDATITIESTATVGKIGSGTGSGWINNWDDLTVSDPLASRTVNNHGTVVGDVQLGLGNDLYDGRNGTVGGTIHGYAGNDTILGGVGGENIRGGHGADSITGGLGNDAIDGGSNIDTAIVSGNRSAHTVTQTSTGVFSVVGADGTDTLNGVEFLQFADQLLRLLPGTGTSVNFNADPDTYMAAIRDFSGNNLGGGDSWQRIGQADVDGDGDLDQFFVNAAIGRFAEVATGPDGLVYFADHGWAGETRVVGTYIDPLVQSGQAALGGPFDSQTRFQNDLLISNINGVLGAADYDRDGLQEVYFKLTDGTAYLHAYMHADGNIRYANYQNQAQVIEFLTNNGWAASTYAGWFPSNAQPAPKAAAVMEEFSFALEAVDAMAFSDHGLTRWMMEYQATLAVV